MHYQATNNTKATSSMVEKEDRTRPVSEASGWSPSPVLAPYSIYCLPHSYTTVLTTYTICSLLGIGSGHRQLIAVTCIAALA